MDNSEPLAAELREAEQELKATLEEACATNLSRANTGELIRVEEMLSIASEAAKKAISIRRKRHMDRRPPGEPANAVMTRRSFTDGDGTTWAAWAVHPDGRRHGANSKLLGDLQRGWLTFECATSKRRLSPIPEGWETLDDVGLRDLLQRAQDAAPARRNDESRG